MTTIRFAIVVVVVLVIQTELFSELRAFGVMPELLLGLTIAAGWNSDVRRGAYCGFAAGFAYDIFLSTPLGLSALTYTLVGYVAGALGAGVADTSAVAFRRLASVAGVAIGVTLFALFGELLTGNDLLNRHLVRVILISAPYTALLMAPLHRAAHWSVAPRRTNVVSRRRTSVLE